MGVKCLRLPVRGDSSATSWAGGRHGWRLRCRVGLPYLVLLSTARRYVWHSLAPLGASPGAGETGEKPRNEALPPRWSHGPRCHSRPLLMKRKEKGIESAGLRRGNASHLTAELLGVSPHAGAQGVASLSLLLMTCRKACLSPRPYRDPAQGEGAAREAGLVGTLEEAAAGESGPACGCVSRYHPPAPCPQPPSTSSFAERESRTFSQAVADTVGALPRSPWHLPLLCPPPASPVGTCSSAWELALSPLQVGTPGA